MAWEIPRWSPASSLSLAACPLGLSFFRVGLSFLPLLVLLLTEQGFFLQLFLFASLPLPPGTLFQGTCGDCQDSGFGEEPFL